MWLSMFNFRRSKRSCEPENSRCCASPLEAMPTSLVPHPDFGTVYDFIVVHQPDGKAGQVIFVVLDKTPAFRRFHRR
jgi:hypothetical protein